MTDLLTMDGVSSRVEAVRFDLLTPALTLAGEVHPDYGTATITNTAGSKIKRALAGMVLRAEELDAVDVLTDRVRPSWVLADGSEYPLGVFLFTDNPRAIRSWGSTGTMAMLDQGVLLDQALVSTISYPAGQQIDAVLADLAAMAGVDSVIADVTGRTVQEPVTWAVGRATYLDAMTDLCVMAGLNSPWFNNWGVLRFSSSNPPLAADFDYDTPARAVAGTIGLKDSSLAAPNRYLVIDTAATDVPITGFYDVPDAAPHSYARRGRRLVRTIEMQGLQDAAAAVDAARHAYATDSDAYEETTFTAVADPRHDTFDTVLFREVLWTEQVWSLELRAGGGHVHTLRREYPIT